MANEEGIKSELKAVFNEGLVKLATESKGIGKDHLETWKDSQDAQEVGVLVREIAELQLRASVAAQTSPGSEDADFLLYRVEKKKLQLAHAVENEKILVAKELKSTFMEVIGAGLAIVKDVGTEVVAVAIQGALKGSMGRLG